MFEGRSISLPGQLCQVHISMQLKLVCESEMTKMIQKEQRRQLWAHKLQNKSKQSPQCLHPLNLSKKTLKYQINNLDHFQYPIPHGLMARILGFHPRGPGSIPGVGEHFCLFFFHLAFSISISYKN